MFWSDTNRDRSRRRLLYQIDLPYDEPNHAKRNGNPSSSIHKSVPKRLFTNKPSVARYFRNRIMPCPTPGLTPRQSLQSQPASTDQAVRLYRFQKICRTSGPKSTAGTRTADQREQRRQRVLVSANKKTNQTEHQSARIEARFARRNHSSSSAR